MPAVLVLVAAFLLAGSNEQAIDDEKCIENYKCIELYKCRTSSDFIYPCNEAQTYVCCPPESVAGNTSVVLRTANFPDICGINEVPDKITGGEIANIGQFPWMALLGYKQRSLDFVEFLCGGSIITEKYILTAAHCIFIDPRLNLVVARVGELDLGSDMDCETVGLNETFCAQPFADMLIEKTIPYEKYNNQTLEGDIALIKLKNGIKFHDNAQPICLPFRNDIKFEANARGKLTVSGWGKTDSSDVGGSTKLQYAHVTVWDQKKCNSSVPPKIRPVRVSQLCANGPRKQDSCKGDSGGPLVNMTVINSDIRYYQVGLVSFSSTQICGNAELPTIYTRVDYYMEWIVSNVL